MYSGSWIQDPWAPWCNYWILSSPVGGGKSKLPVGGVHPATCAVGLTVVGLHLAYPTTPDTHPSVLHPSVWPLEVTVAGVYGYPVRDAWVGRGEIPPR